MKIIKYENNDLQKYGEDLSYFCNACGELHYHGKYDITEEQLPEALKRAYNDLWTDCTGSLCYLVEYKGEYGIALINEFDDYYAENSNTTMDSLFEHMKVKAEEYSKMEEFQTTTILLANEMGFCECHEFVVIMPCDTEKELFDKIAKILEGIYQ